MSTRRARRHARVHAKTILFAAALATAQPISAGLVYDLRFADGSHNQLVTAGDSYTLELWARVSGTNGNNLDEGIQSSMLKVVSTQSSGGAITSGGLSAVAVATDFQSYSGTTPLFANGSGSDLNADGVLDWGSTSTSQANTNYLLVRASGMVTGPGVGHAIDTGTWEFRLATFTVNVLGTGSGNTNFNVVKPNATGPGIAATYAVARVDNVAYNVASNNATRIADTYNNSIGVQFSSSGPAGVGALNWDGGPANNGTEWTEPANWDINPTTSTETVPGPHDNATFAAAGTEPTIGINMAGATNNGSANQAVGSITIAAGSSRDITLQNSSSTSGTFTINGFVGTLIKNNSFKALTIQNGPLGNLTVVLGGSGEISNLGLVSIFSPVTGPRTLTKTGAGLLVLGAANTYSGSTIVSSGTLSLTTAGSLSSAIVTVNSGATLDVAGALSAATSLTNNGNVHFNNPSQPLAALNGAGPVDLQSTALSVAVGTASGAITGNGSLTKTGPGTLALGGNNSYTGGTTVSAGTLQGTTTSLKGNILNNAIVAFDQTSTGTYSSAITGSGSLAKSNSGTVILTGANNFTGGTTITGGTLQVNALTLQGNVFFNAAFLDFDQPTDGIFSGDLSGSGTLVKNNLGQLTLSGNAGLLIAYTVNGGTLQGNTNNIVGNVSNNAKFALDQSFDGTFSGHVTGAGSVTKTGTGTVTFGAQAYTGETAVTRGMLILNSSSGSSSFRAAGGGILRITGSVANTVNPELKADAGGTIQYADAIMMHGGFLRGPGTHTFLGSTDTLSGVTIFAGAHVQQNVPTSLTNITTSGQLTNNASLTWDGGSIGAAGALSVNNTANLSAVDSIGVITVNSGGNLNNSDSNLVAGGGSRTTVNAGGNLNLLNSTTFDVSGGLLVNNGTITGDINGYFGSLTKGAGTFNGTINLFDGARFSPGNSPGAATVGGFTFGAGGIYLFEVADATGEPGFGTDFLNVINTLTITSGYTANSKFLISLASLDASDNPAAPQHWSPTQEYHWTLVHTGAGITGFSPNLFAIDSTSFLAPKGNGSFNITQSGNDLLLNFNPVPEPTSAALLIGLTAGRVLQRRRRSRCFPATTL
jgi:autotransporter-associated beta strand protein